MKKKRTSRKISIEIPKESVEEDRNVVAQTLANQLSKFGRLFQYDPIADYFQLDNPNHPWNPQSHPAAVALIDHPCRGCPHLVLTFTQNQISNKQSGFSNQGSMILTEDERNRLTAYEKFGYSLPKPLCTATPEQERNPQTGQLSYRYRETWSRCPMYGISYANDHINHLQSQIDELVVKINRLQFLTRLSRFPSSE